MLTIGQAATGTPGRPTSPVRNETFRYQRGRVGDYSGARGRLGRLPRPVAIHRSTLDGSRPTSLAAVVRAKPGPECSTRRSARSGVSPIGLPRLLSVLGREWDRSITNRSCQERHPVDGRVTIWAAPDVGLVVGGGATPETIGAFMPSASAVIVGTYLHRDGDERLPVDPARARRILAAASTNESPTRDRHDLRWEGAPISNAIDRARAGFRAMT